MAKKYLFGTLKVSLLMTIILIDGVLASSSLNVALTNIGVPENRTLPTTLVTLCILLILGLTLIPQSILKSVRPNYQHHREEAQIINSKQLLGILIKRFGIFIAVSISSVIVIWETFKLASFINIFIIFAVYIVLIMLILLIRSEVLEHRVQHFVASRIRSFADSNTIFKAPSQEEPIARPSGITTEIVEIPKRTDFSISWPGHNDKSVVTEMLLNPDSPHWNEVFKFTQNFITQKGRNLSPELQEEAIQETMMSVIIALPNFSYESKLTTWLRRIAYSRMIDVIRDQDRDRQYILPQSEDTDNPEYEATTFTTKAQKTIEEEYIDREEASELLLNLVEHLKKQKKFQQNLQILQKVFLEGYNQEETAKFLGIPPPEVGYAVRSFQRYMRENKKT